MATFFFRAVASDGKVRTGSLGAENEKLVARELRKQGLTPIYVGVAPKSASFEIKLPRFTGGRRKDVLFFTQELSTLLNSSVPLDRALSITGELTERKSFQFIVLDVLRVLKSGRSLADSLAAHPDYFGDLYVNMVRAGEASGALAVVFERLAEFERTRDDLRNYIISSMIYPALLATVGLASVVVLLTFVVPRFATIFQDSTMKMPLPTKIMLDVSDVVRRSWLFAASTLLGMIVSWRIYTRTAAGRLWWDSLRIRIPLLGDALLKAETARFARAMGTLVANTVPLVQSIAIAAATLNNKRIAGAMSGVAQGVKRGEGIAAPLRKAAVFPPLAAHLLTVGEETGRLDQMFHRMADIYETDTRASIKRFTAIFEPAVILVMGLLIGALILSMLLAITSINDVQV
ncbi:MAG TPA: type II secretion system F family protein [Candidatus Acidoferrales bacterium]|nr:type II secretion system F family protein [Bryobacteraceae bacterium]HTS67299.1 type II secretion system F family protein [Candidatus Acidoferrales bacterium]